MAKTRKVSQATSRSFKSIGRSLDASRGAIEERTRRDSERLRLAKLQAGQASESLLGGLADVHRFEQDVLKEKQNLEGSVRNRQYEALSIKADRDVDRLKGEAKQAKEYSDYLNELLPKRAKMFGELAMGSLQLADQLKGMAEWDKAHQDGTLDKWTDRQVNQNYNISKNAENDEYTHSLDPDEANANLDRTVRFSSRYAQNKFVDWVKENKDALRQDVIENWTKARGDKGLESFEYGEASAITAMDLGARALLRDLGIGEGTKAGKEIIEQFRLWGSLDQEGYYKQRKVEETTARIDDLYTQYKALPDGKEKELLFNALVRSYKNGWFKEDGKIIDPSKGAITDADAGIMAMRHIIKNDKTITSENVRERFGSFNTPGTQYERKADDDVDAPAKIVKGTGGLWIERHDKRFQEEVVEWADQIWKERGKKINDRLEAKGVHFNREGGEFDLKVQAALKDEQITIQEGYELLSMVDGAKISDAQKRIAFGKVDYYPSNYKPKGNLINFLRAMNDGNLDEALKIARMTDAGLSGQDKKFLNNQLQFTKEIHSVQEGGLKGLLTELENVWKVEEKNKSLLGKGVLSNSGEANVILAQEMVVKEFQSTRFTINKEGEKIPSSVPVEQRWNDAKNKVLDQRKKGQEVMYVNGKLVKADGTELSAEDAANQFNFIRQSGAGEANRSLIYPATATKTQVKAEQARAIIKEKAMTGLENKPDIRNDLFKQVGEYSTYKPESIDYALSSGLMTEKEMLSDEHFIDGLDRSMIYDVAKAYIDGDKTNPHYGVPLDFLLNNDNIRTLMNHDKGKKWTNTTMANALIVAAHPNTPLKDLPQFPADYSDAIAIQNERKPVRFENRPAEALFQGALSQGIAPHSNHVEFMLNGLDKESSYFNEYGIELDVDGTFYDPQKAINSKLFLSNSYDWSTIQNLNIVPLWMQHGFKSEREFQRVRNYEGFR